MDYTKLSKEKLLKKCQELGLTKYKSKNKTELISLIKSIKLTDTDTDTDIFDDLCKSIDNIVIENEVEVEEQDNSIEPKVIFDHELTIENTNSEGIIILNNDCMIELAK